jgi:anti-sigma B factor antagonist
MITEPILDSGRKCPDSLVEVKEQELSLRMETSSLRNAVVVHCSGKIIYRYEAAALSHKVAALLENYRLVILDLQHVSAIDSAGLGELVALHMWARGHGRDVKLSGVTSRIHTLLELTNLTSVLEIYATEEHALEASHPEVA